MNFFQNCSKICIIPILRYNVFVFVLFFGIYLSAASVCKAQCTCTATCRRGSCTITTSGSGSCCESYCIGGKPFCKPRATLTGNVIEDISIDALGLASLQAGINYMKGLNTPAARRVAAIDEEVKAMFQRNNNRITNATDTQTYRALLSEQQNLLDSNFTAAQLDAYEDAQ